MNLMIRSDLLYGTNKLNADGCSKGNPGETMTVYSERKRCVVMLLPWQSCARSVGTSLTVILEKRTENVEIEADSQLAVKLIQDGDELLNIQVSLPKI